MKKYFFDKKGNKNNFPFLICFTFIVIIIMLNQVYRYQEEIAEYFRAMEPIIIISLLFLVFIMSFTKIIQTKYDDKADKYIKVIRLLLDGTIVFTLIIAVIVGLSVSFKIQFMLSILFKLFKSTFAFNVLGLIFSIFVVSVCYSMVENVYIILKVIIKKVHDDVKDIKEVYSIIIAMIATILSLLSLMN